MNRRSRALLVTGLVAATAAGAAAGCRSSGEPAADDDTPEPPAYVTAAERAAVPQLSPAEDPEAWRLAFLDVETTGLVPGYHEMIDMGVVMTDVDGRVLDSLFVRIQPEHPERTSEGARAVNAFDPAQWSDLGALAPAAAVDSLRAFHERTAGSHPVLLVAFNSQFDAAFLDQLFRTSGGSWRELYHYFVLDIPSMAWALGYRDLTGTALARRLEIPDEPHVAEDHTGITGAMLNARLYRALRAKGMTPVPDPSRSGTTATSGSDGR